MGGLAIARFLEGTGVVFTVSRDGILVAIGRMYMANSISAGVLMSTSLRASGWKCGLLRLRISKCDCSPKSNTTSQIVAPRL